jgi:hypothetical protein
VRDTVIHGGPSDIADEVAAYIEAGARHVQLVNMAPLADPALAATSDARLTEAVALLRAAVAAT